MKFLLFMLLIFGITFSLHAQELSYKGNDSDSRNAGSTKIFGSGKSSTKKFSKSSWAVFKKTRKNYEKKLRKLMRKRKKEAKKREKYSDPLLFGHKNHPEKRSVKEKKVCPVCQIKH